MLLLRLLARRPVLGSELGPERWELLERDLLRHPAHRLHHHRATLVLAHRAEILDRDEARDRLVRGARELRAFAEPAERLARDPDRELGVAPAVVGAAEHGDVGVVAPDPELHVLAGAEAAERRVDPDPSVGRDVRLDPGVRGRWSPRRSRGSRSRTGPGGPHGGRARAARGRSPGRRPEPPASTSATELSTVVVPTTYSSRVADVLGGAAEEGERALVGLLGQERPRDLRRLVARAGRTSSGRGTRRARPRAVSVGHVALEARARRRARPRPGLRAARRRLRG